MCGVGAEQVNLLRPPDEAPPRVGTLVCTLEAMRGTRCNALMAVKFFDGDDAKNAKLRPDIRRLSRACCTSTRRTPQTDLKVRRRTLDRTALMTVTSTIVVTPVAPTLWPPSSAIRHPTAGSTGWVEPTNDSWHGRDAEDGQLPSDMSCAILRSSATWLDDVGSVGHQL